MVLNNKILRVLQMQPRDAHTVQLYKRYNTLPIPELHNYQIFLLVHKLLYNNNKLPAAFDGYFVPNSAVHSYSARSSSDLHLLSPQTAVGKKLIKFKTSQLWNRLPDQLKQIRSPNSFKLQLKNYLLNKIC